MMRERLINLIDRADEECKHTKDCKICSGYGKGSRCMNYHIADYLLANGVVVMPCKVGGKVYIISRNKVKECVVSYIGFSAVASYSSINFVEYYADGTFYRTHSASFDEIGKTVFLTREDAERALRKECERK